MHLKILKSLFTSCIGIAALTSRASEVRIAAASNFSPPLDRLARLFEKQSGDKLFLSFGSTGKLYTQIQNGAPFDVFLSADREHVKKLIDKQAAVRGTDFSYAIGNLILWSAKPDAVDSEGLVLTNGTFKHLSIANPKLAPYGIAAKQALNKMGIWKPLEARLVLGDSLTQAYQFVASGNAELGFVSLSQIKLPPDIKTQGSYWVVPKSMYTPIFQDAVLLRNATANPAAKRFLEFLKGDIARKLISEFGYDLPP